MIKDKQYGHTFGVTSFSITYSYMYSRDTVKTYLSPKRTPDEKSKRTPVKSQNVLPTKSKRTIDEVKTYPYC